MKDVFRGLFPEKPNQALEERLKQIQAAYTEAAEEQARQTGVGSYKGEASRIAQACGMFKLGQGGYYELGSFQSLALEILQYPPELGYAVLSQMSLFEDQLKYNPIGRTMVSIGTINSNWSPVIARVKYLDQRPELARLIEDKEYRAEKAGKFIAVAILQAAPNVAEVMIIYKSNTFDPAVQKHLIQGVEAQSPDIARIMTGGKR